MLLPIEDRNAARRNAGEACRRLTLNILESERARLIVGAIQPDVTEGVSSAASRAARALREEIARISKITVARWWIERFGSNAKVQKHIERIVDRALAEQQKEETKP